MTGVAAQHAILDDAAKAESSIKSDTISAKESKIANLGSEIAKTSGKLSASQQECSSLYQQLLVEKDSVSRVNERLRIMANELVCS